TLVRLPADGTSVPVEVSAGSTMRLVAKGGLSSVDLSTPNAEPTTIVAGDALAASLRTKGVASAETGTYGFGAKGSVQLEVIKPRWKAKTVFVPRLPDDPTRLAQFDFALGWNPRQAPMEIQPSEPISRPALASPVAIDVRDTSSRTTATLFVGGAVSAAGTFVE